MSEDRHPVYNISMAANATPIDRLQYHPLEETEYADSVDANEHLHKENFPPNTTAGYSPQTSTSNSHPTPIEPKKAVLSSSLYTLLTWHTGTAISITATAFLLFLNLAECTVDPRIGSSPAITSNILGTLQVIAKFHEMMIIISLVNITRQWVQRSLLEKSGTLLGLVGAELSIMNAGYLVSNEYWAAVKLGVIGCFGGAKGPESYRQRQSRGTMLFLFAFLPVACLLCIFGGPSSAILMIPRQDWYFGEIFDIMNYSQLPVETSNYPSIFIDPRLSPGNNYVVATLSNEDYWSSLWSNITTSTDFFDEYDEMTHTAADLGVLATNTSTVWGRPLTLDARWKGKSNFRGIMMRDLIVYYEAWVSSRAKDFKIMQKYSQSRVRATTEMTGLEMDIVCRLEAKQTCGHDIAVDDHEWCYAAASSDASGGPLLSNRDLLLISEHRPYQRHQQNQDYMLPRLYLTEGLGLKDDQRFTDSILFVFEEYDGSNLFVCTTNATLKAATITIYDISKLSDLKAQYHQYLSHFDNSTTTLEPAQRLLYHEHWLDTLHMYDYDRERATFVGPENQPIPGLEPPSYSTPRFYRGETSNSKLKSWGTNVLQSASFWGGPIWISDQDWDHLLQPNMNYTLNFDWRSNNPALPPWEYIEAGMVEIALGGSWFTMLLNTNPSTSQYPDAGYPFADSEIPSSIMQNYPEPIRNYRSSFYKPLTLYHFAYGYRLTGRTGVLAAFLLSLHAFVALAGSLCQLRHRGVIIAWGTLPEYITLCMGSQPVTEGIKNTCAGIQKYETLQCRVRIRETVGQHLEMAVVGGGGDSDMVDVRKKTKYGEFSG